MSDLTPEHEPWLFEETPTATIERLTRENTDHVVTVHLLQEQLRLQNGALAKAREALEWYANPEIYKPHPHGLAFDNRDLSYVARAALPASEPK